MVEQEKKYSKEKIVKDLEEFYLAHYAIERLSAGDSDEGEIAGKVHLTKTSNLEDLLEQIGLEGSFMEAVKVHAGYYENRLSELKVTDAFEYLKAPEAVTKQWASYLTSTVGELRDGAQKYKEALKKLGEAKTEQEALEAFKQKTSYESFGKAYVDLSVLNSVSAKEKAARVIAEYKRKQLAKKYAKQEKEQKKAA